MELWWNSMMVLALYQQNGIFVFAEGLISVFGQTCLATAGPVISATALFARLAKKQNGRNIIEQLHSDENLKIMHIHLRLVVRLDLSIGWVI